MSWYEIIKKWSLTRFIRDVYWTMYSNVFKKQSIKEWLIYNVDEFLYGTGVPKFRNTSKNPDKLIVEIEAWVHNNVEYLGDTEQYRMPEFWQTAKKVLINLMGDCEDLNGLVFVLARQNGIPATQLENVLGPVDDGTKKGTGGHYYLRYTTFEGNVYIIDTCYHYTSKQLKNRKIASEQKYYFTPWIDGINDITL